MEILDDPVKIKSLDSLDMLGVEEKFYDQLVEAKKIAQSVDISRLKLQNTAGIAILGMGGSGFAGDIVKSLVIDSVAVPVEIVKGYELPGFVAGNWLVIGVSYSGNTEETISAARQALKRGCELLAVSAGGEIERIAEQNGKTHVKVPSGYQPRGASGYLFFTTFLLLGRLGFIKISDNEIEEALSLISEKAELYGRNTGTEKNPAKKLAVELFGRLPVIYGINGFLSTVAYRWKCEINENSKCPCFWAEFPELNHNETVGWDNLKEQTQKMVLVVFRDAGASDKIRVRIETTVKLIREQFDLVVEVPVEGKSRLAKALSTIYLGDIASVYLAFLYNTDPTPVDRIAVLKAELAKLD